MYSLRAYGEMLEDAVRMDAYARALERVVTGNSIVLDIGAGTGVLSLLAVRFGARRVHAIELSPLGTLISEAARENGMLDRIIVHATRSTEVSLPERADVIVSDLRGVLPPFHRHLRDIVDARSRLLAPSGHMVPHADRLFVALVAAEKKFHERRAAWVHGIADLKLSSALRYADNGWVKHNAEPDDLLSQPARWSTLDYTTISNPAVRGSVQLEVDKEGTAHGLLVWFDAELTDGVTFSNRPGAPKTIYGQAYFPWPRPVDLRAGDQIGVELRADPLAGETIWTWTTELPPHVSGGGEQRFRQSDVLAQPLASDTLRKKTATFSPTLSTDGELTHLALSRMREGTTLEALATDLHARHPERLRSFDEALDFVAELSARYSK